jgi:nucleotide-binding universal stress UspA family protein
MIRRIVHATDFSKASRAAFAKALELATANRAALTLVHVLTPPLPLMGDGYISAATYDQLDASSRAWARKQLDALMARARAQKVKVTGVLREGIIHEQILRAARAGRADLLVLGSHGRTGVAKFFLGSVAGRVAGSARMPVLTVRGA